MKKESGKEMENGSFHMISGDISRCSSLKVSAGVSDLLVEVWRCIVVMKRSGNTTTVLPLPVPMLLFAFLAFCSCMHEFPRVFVLILGAITHTAKKGNEKSAFNP